MYEVSRSLLPLREEVSNRDIMPFIGVYDVFSATIAAQHYDALFISGFGFAASYYGLPDIGFITWTDITAFVQRIRTVLPDVHLLVDIDDGYCDTEVACHTVSVLEAMRASGVVLEDQRRPRHCGHFDGKLLMEVDDYVKKLEQVLATRREMFVVARTDARDPEDIFRRVDAYAAAGADAILVDGLRDLAILSEVKSHVDLPVVFNQIAGGKSPLCSLTELCAAGASMVIYSTPCLFPVQEAIHKAMLSLRERDGRLPAVVNGTIGVADCTRVLNENIERRAYR